MSARNRVCLSADEVLHRLELQEAFEDEYCSDLEEESCDEDKAEGDFSTSDGQEMLVECDVLTDKGYLSLSQLTTAAGRDSLLLLDTEVGEVMNDGQGKF